MKGGDRDSLDWRAIQRAAAGLDTSKPPSRKAPKGAKLMPFPPARRHDLVRNIARGMTKASSREKAAAHLDRQLEIQAETMRRRGFAARTIQAELRALRSAVQVALWRCVITPDHDSPEIA